MTTETPPARRVARKGRRREDRAEELWTGAPITTRRLTKRYGDLVAVDNLDLEVQAGEIFGLLGQNGAGKTTTILMLLGLTEPTRGGSRVAGYDPTRHPLEVKRRVGYLPDSVGFYGNMTGRENLRYTARLNGIVGRDAERRMETVLEQVRLTARADTKVDTYSRGMLQRLGIADALLKDPQVLILDEPTTAIDPIGVIEILDLLREQVAERGMAVLLSSHLLSQVQSVCDRVGIFAAGRLIGVGTVPELARRFGEETSTLEIGFENMDRAAAARAEKLFAGIDHVREVVPPSGSGQPFGIRVAPQEAVGSVRSAALAIVAREGYQLTSVREVVASLDDIYRHALREQGLAQASMGAPGR